MVDTKVKVSCALAPPGWNLAEDELFPPGTKVVNQGVPSWEREEILLLVILR
jgi:hypothetical protein